MNENKSAEVDWVGRVFKRYQEVGRLIPERQEKLYKKISLEFCTGKTVADIGCSLGIGSNILSHEARFVWGVDINEKAIEFATKTFKRPNMDFMVLDIEKPPTREFAKFDVVAMIECLEHLADPEGALNNLKRFFHDGTVGFITCPNEANDEVRENEAKHGYHLQKVDAGAFYEQMTRHFRSVTLYSVDKLENWAQEETVDGNSKDYLIVARVEGII